MRALPPPFSAGPPYNTLGADKIAIPHQHCNIDIQGTVRLWVSEQMMYCLKRRLHSICGIPLVFQKIQAYLSCLPICQHPSVANNIVVDPRGSRRMRESTYNPVHVSVTNSCHELHLRSLHRIGLRNVNVEQPTAMFVRCARRPFQDGCPMAQIVLSNGTQLSNVRWWSLGCELGKLRAQALDMGWGRRHCLRRSSR